MAHSHSQCKLKCTRSISVHNKKHFHETLQNKVTSDIQTGISDQSLPGIQLLSFTVSQHSSQNIKEEMTLKLRNKALLTKEQKLRILKIHFKSPATCNIY
jgi:hypothetical protein